LRPGRGREGSRGDGAEEKKRLKKMRVRDKSRGARGIKEDGGE